MSDLPKGVYLAKSQDSKSLTNTVTLELEKLIQEKELSELQISQLQEELELITAQSSSLQKKADASIKQKDLEKEQALVIELQAQLEQQLKQTQLLENNNARLQEQLSQL